jgi:ribose-phosphate pyrophosphokinase
VLLIDDMISTGGTIARSIEALLAAGAKPGITVVATHGLFVGGAREVIDTPAVAQFVVTDSIAPEKWEKLRIASIAPLLASAISRTGGFHERFAVDWQVFAGAA